MTTKKRASAGPKFNVAKVKMGYREQRIITALIYEPESRAVLDMNVMAWGKPDSDNFRLRCFTATAQDFQDLVDVEIRRKGTDPSYKLEWREGLTGPEVNSFIFSEVTAEQRRFFERMLNESVAKCISGEYSPPYSDFE